MKKNLIFLHIAKNGGSTFHSLLERLYSDKKIFSIRVKKPLGLNTDEFTSLPENERRNIKLLKGHMIFGLHEYLYGNSEYTTFLRKPLGRIISYYHYVLSRPTHELHKLVKKNNMGLEEFVQNEGLINRQDFHNAQIQKISGIKDKPQFMLEKALQNIEKHFPVVGLLERYDESLILMKEYYHWKLPFYQIQNETKNKKSLNQINQGTIALIEELNQEDYSLYHEMEKRFGQQIESIGSSKFKLELYRLLVANNVYNNRYLRMLRKIV